MESLVENKEMHKKAIIQSFATPYFSNLKRVSFAKVLQAHPPTEQIRFHFASLVPEKLLQDAITVEYLWDSYYDTEEFSFMKKNTWIRKRGKKWLVRRVKLTHSENGFHYFENEELTFDSQQEVEEALHCRGLVRVVEYQFHRFWLSNSETLQAATDVVDIPPNNFYVVSQWIINEGKGMAHDLVQHEEDILVPVRSKVIEVIYRQKPELYQQLEECGVISKANYIDIENVTSFINKFPGQEKSVDEDLVRADQDGDDEDLLPADDAPGIFKFEETTTALVLSSNEEGK